MAGITKLAADCLPAADAQLRDISHVPMYGNLLGFNEIEIAHYFSEHLKKAGEVLGVSSQQLLDDLPQQYGGFCFDEEGKHRVYCPWSILSFLNRPSRGWQNYWFTSGGQFEVLKSYLVNDPLSGPISYSTPLTVRLSELKACDSYETLQPKLLLARAGYLSIQSIDAGENALLAYPNREISHSMAQLYADALLKNKRINTESRSNLLPAIRTGKTEDVIGFFNEAAEAIDHLAHPIQDAEAYAAYMQVLLIDAGLIPEVCRRIDRRLLVVETDAIKWVFEFEVAANASEVPKLLEEAVRRIEHSRQVARCGRETQNRVGLVFDGAARRFTAWRQV